MPQRSNDESPHYSPSINRDVKETTSNSHQLGNPEKVDDFLESFRSVQSGASSVLLLLFLTLVVSWYVGIEEYKDDHRELYLLDQALSQRIDNADLFRASNFIKDKRSSSTLLIQEFARDTGCTLTQLNQLFTRQNGRVPIAISDNARHAIVAADICKQMGEFEQNQKELEKRKIEFNLLGTKLTASIWLSFAIWSAIFSWFCIYLFYKRLQLYGLLAKSLLKLREAHGHDRQYVDLVGTPAFWMAPTTIAPLCGLSRGEARRAFGWVRFREYVPFLLILLPIACLLLMSWSVIETYIVAAPNFGKEDIEKKPISLLLTFCFVGAGIAALCAAFFPAFDIGVNARREVQLAHSTSVASDRRLFLIIGGGTVGALLGVIPFNQIFARHWPGEPSFIDAELSAGTPRYQGKRLRHKQVKLEPGFYQRLSSNKVHYVDDRRLLLYGANQQLEGLTRLSDSKSPFRRFVDMAYAEIPESIAAPDGQGRADLQAMSQTTLPMAIESEALKMAERGETTAACKMLLAAAIYDITTKRVAVLNLRILDVLAGLAVRYGQEEAIETLRLMIARSTRSSDPSIRARFKKWDRKASQWRKHWIHKNDDFPSDRVAWKRPLACSSEDCSELSPITYHLPSEA